MKYIKITSHFITLISLPPSFFPITHLFMQSISLFISSHPCFHHPSLSPNALFSVCLSFSIFSVPLLPVLGAVPQQGGGGRERERGREGERERGERERENVDGGGRKEVMRGGVCAFCPQSSVNQSGHLPVLLLSPPPPFLPPSLPSYRD